jgi:1,4-alpha-glucan branching enzyme
MSLKKKFLKSKPVCKTTFTVPAEAADGAKHVYLVGEFNDWDPVANPMQARKDGSFSLTLDLEQGKSFQFRYLVDGRIWENEPEADEFAPTPFASENSVVVV